MADALSAFRRIQIGEESSPGTAVAATMAAVGVIGSFESGEVLHQPDEDRNTLARNVADDLFVGKEAHLVWTGDVNMLDIAYALSMAIRGNVTPSASGNENTWTFAPALTTANTPDQANGIDTFTFEYGDNVQAYETEYCFATRLEISGAPNATCQFTCDITGRQRSETTFTAALSPAATQRFPFNLAKFYIDSSGAGLGGTQKTATLKGFTWTLETMFAPLYTADGNLYFSSVTEDKKRVSLALTYARNTTSEAERDKYDARTTTFIRIEMLGNTVIDSNVPYLNLDGAYRYVAWPSIGEENGLSTVEVVAESVYDATWAKQFEVELMSSLTAL